MHRAARGHENEVRHPRISEARQVLAAVEMPREQRNERSALVLLALLDLTPDKSWRQAEAPLMGVTPIMDWARSHYGKVWKPNTRETVRRRTIHQFVAGGLVLYNPDRPERPVNSPQTVYRITPEALSLLRAFGSTAWEEALSTFLARKTTLAARYAAERVMRLVPVQGIAGREMMLSVGKHSTLIRAIVEEFAPRFVPGAELIYVGDTGRKWAYFAKERLTELGVTLDAHGKMPDVVLFDGDRKWLVLVESVSSHGPMDPKRHEELSALFKNATAGLVYVTAFPNRTHMKKHLADISWQTEVWCADSPTHLIHFNGARFLGPYGKDAG